MKKKLIEGLVKRHPDGFGFLIPDDPTHPDVYIPRHSMNGVMSNDKVAASVEPERGGARFRGEVVRIIQRSARQLIGHFRQMNDKMGLLPDEGHGWGEDLKIPLADSLGAKDGDLVAAEIVSYPEEGKKFTGRVKEIIGNIEDPLNDIRRVILGNHIPDEFPAPVSEEASRFGEQPAEADFKGRRDLRSLRLVTIDGVTAKDFDDAVHVGRNNQGFLLHVAIADVSHYVRPGSAIDKEAYQRGTSVYFPNFVVPMLPEVLSNGLCSLNPHVPRLCLVAEMQFDFSGEMIRSEFYEAVMESKARVTYGKAQELVDGTDVPELSHVKDVILQCADLAKILMAKRFREGSLDLEIPETYLQVDSQGRPTDVIRSERLFSHRLIEELMLAANVAVAKFFAQKDIPALYRIHEPPKEEALGILERYLETFGSRLQLGGGHLQKKLSRALEEFTGKPQMQILHILTLRSMSQAKYHLENVGHFGLGFEFYTHFTSPIRRYPDLIVHRLLKNLVMPGSAYRLMSEEDLLAAGTWLSGCEQRSVKAERQLMAIKKARFMQPRLGEEHDGMISSVAKFGVFVLLRDFEVDGLVRTDDLSSEALEFDEEHLRLVAPRSGRSFSIGDPIRVQVAAAETGSGQISFVPAKSARSDFGVGKRADDRDTRNTRDQRKHRRERESSKTFSKGRSDRRQHSRSEPRSEPRSEHKSESRAKPRTEPRFQSKSPAQAAAPGKKPKSLLEHLEARIASSRDDRQGDRRDPSGRNDRRLKPRFGAKRGTADDRKNPDDRSGFRRRDDEPSSHRKSRKLQFADRSKVRLNEDDETQSSRKNPAKRLSSEDDRGGVREARVSRSGGKGPSGKISHRKAERRRRNR